MELLSIKRDKGLIDNFFYLGMNSEMYRVIDVKERAEEILPNLSRVSEWFYITGIV